MPTRDTAWPNGTPCWIDYGAADLEAAKAFYADLLGWSCSGGDPQFGGYLTCTVRELAVAGMAPQQDPGDPPRWTTYFATDDAAATADRISRAGGSVVVPPMEVGPMGTMAIVRDPEGQPFGLWQAGGHTGVQLYNEPGALIWNEAGVADLAAAKDFYADVFGFTFTDYPDMGGYATFATGETPLGGLSPLSPGVSPGWTTCFSVASTDEAVAVVEKAGGAVAMPAEDSEFGRIAVLADPWGAPFSVMQEPPG